MSFMVGWSQKKNSEKERDREEENKTGQVCSGQGLAHEARKTVFFSGRTTWFYIIFTYIQDRSLLTFNTSNSIFSFSLNTNRISHSCSNFKT